MICVFDIETTPDTDLIKEYFNLDSSLDEIEVCEYAFNAQKEKTGSEFLPIYFHKIVCISSVICDDFGHFKKVGNFGKNSNEEKDIIQDFLNYLNKVEPRFVSFNGRGFDFPCIMLRAMKFNLNAYGFFNLNGVDKNKYENYRARYSEKWHTDLLDSLGNFGIRNLTLDGICKMLNLVGKYDINGADVYKLYINGDFEKIKEYCQSDVLNTYWLYLKYAILRSEISIEDYALILNKWKEELDSSKAYTEHFKAAIELELNNLEI